MPVSITFLTLSLATLLASNVNSSAGQGHKQWPVQSAEGRVTARPYRGPGYESIPVEVLDVSMKEAEREFNITNLTLKNRFPKSVRAVKFTWILTRQEKDEVWVVRQGLSTAWIALPRPLPHNEKLELSLSPVVFKIQRMMLGSLDPNADYRLEILVDDVLYTDGSSWKPHRRFWPAASKQALTSRFREVFIWG